MAIIITAADGYQRDTRDMTDGELLEHYRREARRRLADEAEKKRNQRIRDEAETIEGKLESCRREAHRRTAGETGKIEREPADGGGGRE